jgi:hypothetical protein
MEDRERTANCKQSDSHQVGWGGGGGGAGRVCVPRRCSVTIVHCKDTVPKIGNKYSQK